MPETPRREIREELSAEIVELTLLAVVENIFRSNGDVGHEVVALYTGRPDPEPAGAGAALTESGGTIVPVVWRPVDDAATDIPLYPVAAVDWVHRDIRTTRHHATQDCGVADHARPR